MPCVGAPLDPPLFATRVLLLVEARCVPASLPQPSAAVRVRSLSGPCRLGTRVHNPRAGFWASEVPRTQRQQATLRCCPAAYPPTRLNMRSPCMGSSAPTTTHATLPRPLALRGPGRFTLRAARGCAYGLPTVRPRTARAGAGAPPFRTPRASLGQISSWLSYRSTRRDMRGKYL